ncbi:Oidioi.mRNA.OKI2018_I69.chr1.g1351.t1.cds [Oikopleura dioica]|uniref:Oidioi.mRNA.OKI2018_I69.chr1.g1351.t1.cds n=1 Tax=Oikopleura dioica TaxID=34765 RepID=A0ABN7SMM4_OIKDI|nr:Oidioi.mRNA.OKI2018_I69.chr1.g1351.t1.cds [Oikopleura dioica]
MSAPFTRSKARHVEIIDRAIEEAEFLRDLLLQELGQEEEQDMEVEEPEFPRGKLAKGARKLVNKIGGGKRKRRRRLLLLWTLFLSLHISTARDPWAVLNCTGSCESASMTATTALVFEHEKAELWS